MPVDQGLTYLPLAELGALLRGREISPVELLEHTLTTIDALDPQLNAVVTRLDDTARAQAKECEARLQRGEGRALEGIPIPIKDNVMVAGARMTAGSPMGPGFPMPEDCTLVRRLREAGAVFPATSNLPEFGTIPSTERGVNGTTRNPWDLSRTPGGSSGGAAAMVAAGMVPAAHGNDGGGSLRIPSALCNLFTLKPTRGRISRGPIDNDGFGLIVDGFLTRSVRDNAALLDVVVGSVNGDPYWSPRPSPSFSEEVGREPGTLHIAWSVAPPAPDSVVHPACAAAVRDAAALLAGLGHEVEEHDPVSADESVVQTFLQLWGAVVGMGIELLAMFGGDKSTIEPHNRALYELGSSLTSIQFAVARATLDGWVRRGMAMYDTYDVVLTPTTCEPALILERIFEGEEADPMQVMHNAVQLAGYTVAANVSGQPAVQLPLAMHEGLPVGVMASGRLGEDALLLRLSAQVEAARPWADRRPPLHA